MLKEVLAMARKGLVYHFFGPVWQQLQEAGLKVSALYSTLKGKKRMKLWTAVKYEEASGGKIKTEWLIPPDEAEALRELLKMRGARPAPENPIQAIQALSRGSSSENDEKRR